MKFNLSLHIFRLNKFGKKKITTISMKEKCLTNLWQINNC